MFISIWQDIWVVPSSLVLQIEHNEIDLVIFLRDPLTPKSHEPDVNNVVKLCDTHNIPLATNLATAELLIRVIRQRRFRVA